MRKVLFLSLLLIAVTGLASATSVDFSSFLASTGQISLSSGNLVGSDIALDMYTLNGTDYALTGTAEGGLYASLDFNTGTGLLTITGGVPALSIPNGSSLLSGNILSFSTVGCTATDQFCNITFSDVLASGIHLSGYTAAGNMDPAGGPWHEYGSTDLQGATPTPEPASFGLLASSLAIIGGVYRRKLAR